MKLLLLIKFILLGLIQGLTEPIPVSSSGHLVLIRELFKIEMPSLSFEIAVHFGSLIAITHVYYDTLKKLLLNSVNYLKTKQTHFKHDFNFVLYLCVSTFITGVIGLAIKPFISDTLTKPAYVGIALLVTGLLLFLVRHMNGTRSEAHLTWRDALIIGFAQSIALIPGISRSGMTVMTALLLGQTRQTALKFSFLLFIPVTLGVTLLSVNDFFNSIDDSGYAIPYLLAFIASIIATYIGLKWFINIFINGRLVIFAIYCLIIGLLAIFFI